MNVLLDTDQNRATGQWNGSDHFLHYWVSPRSSGWSLTRWSGKDWQPVPQSAPTSFRRSGDVCTWTLGRQDLGGTSGFAIRVAGVLTDAGGKKVLARDEAPDTGSWAYVLSSNPPPTTQSTPTRPERVARPVIGRPTTVPARPVAGRRLTVRFPVVRSDDGTPLTGGKMTCDPSVAGKVVPHAERLANGVARLTFVVPPRARGRLLKVKVTIELDGRSATRVATFRVR